MKYTESQSELQYHMHGLAWGLKKGHGQLFCHLSLEHNTIHNIMDVILSIFLISSFLVSIYLLLHCALTYFGAFSFTLFYNLNWSQSMTDKVTSYLVLSYLK